jgi:hypothetical protein
MSGTGRGYKEMIKGAVMDTTLFLYGIDDILHNRTDAY